jgi:hypothetical protein
MPGGPSKSPVASEAAGIIAVLARATDDRGRVRPSVRLNAGYLWNAIDRIKMTAGSASRRHRRPFRRMVPYGHF